MALISIWLINRIKLDYLRTYVGTGCEATDCQKKKWLVILSRYLLLTLNSNLTRLKYFFNTFFRWYDFTKPQVWRTGAAISCFINWRHIVRYSLSFSDKNLRRLINTSCISLLSTASIVRVRNSFRWKLEALGVESIVHRLTALFFLKI